MSKKIKFFSEDVDFVLKEKGKIRQWISDVIQQESNAAGEINYIFCSDNFLLELNKSFLGHTTLTDIITFPNTDSKQGISGEIYISVDRVDDNAVKFNQSFQSELKRVMVHGVLHLLGYKDKSKEEKTTMRSKEDLYLKEFDSTVSRGT